MNKEQLDAKLMVDYNNTTSVGERVHILETYIDNVSKLPKSDFCKDCNLCSPKFTPTYVEGYDNESSSIREFWRNLAERTPVENPDDYRELPETLTSHYPEPLRVLMDCGRITFKDLIDPSEQLRAIEFLKCQGAWERAPTTVKIAIFFGQLDVPTMKSARLKVEQELKEEARIFFKIQNEEEIMGTILTQNIKKAMQNV